MTEAQTVADLATRVLDSVGGGDWLPECYENAVAMIDEHIDKAVASRVEAITGKPPGKPKVPPECAVCRFLNGDRSDEILLEVIEKMSESLFRAEDACIEKPKLPPTSDYGAFGSTPPAPGAPFCRCPGKHDDANWCSDPEMVIAAINDAKDEMSHSNYHNGKLNIAIEVIEAYIAEKNIPRRFVAADKEHPAPDVEAAIDLLLRHGYLITKEDNHE